MTAIAARFGAVLQPVHEDESSILMLDREPHAWKGSREQGFGWVEGVEWRGGATDWAGAARHGACGLVVRGRHRFVHSSVNGLGPVYWMEDGGATYFATRIDPLAMTAPGKLSVDWDAWATIIALRYPLGERTPFAEIGRLGPSSTLRRRLGRRTRSHSSTWPWAEIEPDRGLEAAADDAAEALREALTLPPGPAICPLSGGYDSRLVLSTLARLGRNALTAVTVSDDEGSHLEEELAASVAARLGVTHELIPAHADEYPVEWDERATLVEYQFVDHAWLVPVARRTAGSSAHITDGYALDTLMRSGDHFFTPEVVEPPDPRAGSIALYDTLRRFGLAHLAFSESFHAPILARARSQFEDIARPFEGHGSQPILALYAVRTVRGISTYPNGLLGSRAEIVTPGVDDRVVNALLSTPTVEKRNQGMQLALQRRLAPELIDMKSTGTTPRESPQLPRRWCSRQSIDAHRERIENGPFSPYVSAELTAWLTDPNEGELSPDLRLGMEAISLFHAWWSRYRDRLGNVDPTELKG